MDVNLDQEWVISITARMSRKEFHEFTKFLETVLDSGVGEEAEPYVHAAYEFLEQLKDKVGSL